MRNFHPHKVVIETDAGTVRIPAEGKLVRLREIDQDADCLDVDGVQVPLIERRYVPPNNLPAGIVSLPTLMALAADGVYRPDLLTVDTGPGSAIRDDRGQVVAVKRLMRLAPPSRAYSPRARVLEVAEYGMFDGSQPAHFLIYITPDGWLYPGRFPGWHGGVEPETLPEEMEREVKTVISRLAREPRLVGDNGCAQGVEHGLGNDERVYPLQERLARRAAHMLSDRLCQPVAICACDVSISSGQVVGESEVSLMHWQISAGTSIGTEEG